MNEMFTEAARKAIEYARDEASRLRHDYIGTEHLLLGLLREQEGLAARVLVSLDVRLEDVRAEILDILGAGMPPMDMDEMHDEHPGMPSGSSSAGMPLHKPSGKKQGRSKTPALDAFGRRLGRPGGFQ